jgi:hypothetical protein
MIRERLTTLEHVRVSRFASGSAFLKSSKYTNPIAPYTDPYNTYPQMQVGDKFNQFHSKLSHDFVA